MKMINRSRKGQARGEATRAAIMRAATGLFAESGFKGTAVRTIVREAGASMGSFYHHFRDKADLYIQIADEGGLAVRRFMRRVGDFGTGQAMEDRVWEFFSAYVDAADKHDAMVLLLLAEKETLPPAIKEVVSAEIDHHRRELEEGLASGVQAGVLVPMDVRMASEAVVGMVLHLLKVYFTDPTVERKGIVDALARGTIGILRTMPGNGL